MAERVRARVTVEEYVEWQAESAAGRLVQRRYRRAHWAPDEAAESTARQVAQTAGPLLRAVAIAVAPTLGRLAVRALAPRLRAALPAPRGLRALPRPAGPAPRRSSSRASGSTAGEPTPSRVLPPLSLPPPTKDG